MGQECVVTKWGYCHHTEAYYFPVMFYSSYTTVRIIFLINDRSYIHKFIATFVIRFLLWSFHSSF